MDMGDQNPNAHPVEVDHISNPFIVIHATCMFVAYGILLPVGIMLGIRRHRYHVPWNAFAILVALAGYFFGYTHHVFGPEKMENMDGAGGVAAPQDANNQPMPGMGMRLDKRAPNLDTSAEALLGWGFKSSAHSIFGTFLLLLLFVQVGMGVYRKMTKAKASLRIRWLPAALSKNIHAYLGKAHMVLAYIQILLGFVKLFDSCKGQGFGQCVAHLTMGGSFWWYGGIYLAYLANSFPSVTRPEYYESILMTVWGVINFTFLHKPGTRWSHSDLQHTSLGLLWIFGGSLSILIESRFNPFSFLTTKNPLPAIMIILTGYAMGVHAQYYAFATVVHTVFGYCLMLAGLTRLVQLALRPGPRSDWVPRDEDDDELTSQDTLRDPTSQLAPSENRVSSFFGFLSAMGLISAGILFQSAHEEQLNIIMYYLSDPSTYVNWLMALSFFCMLYMLILNQVGKKQSNNGSSKGGVSIGGTPTYNRVRARGSEEQGMNRRDIELSGFLEESAL